jgi:hypothetical protein
MMALRMIVILEAVYFLLFLPGALWRSVLREITIANWVQAILPTLIESLAVPIVLAKLFSDLSPNKSAKGAIK